MLLRHGLRQRECENDHQTSREGSWVSEALRFRLLHDIFGLPMYHTHEDVIAEFVSRFLDGLAERGLIRNSR